MVDEFLFFRSNLVRHAGADLLVAVVYNLRPSTLVSLRKLNVYF